MLATADMTGNLPDPGIRDVWDVSSGNGDGRFSAHSRTPFRLVAGTLVLLALTLLVPVLGSSTVLVPAAALGVLVVLALGRSALRAARGASGRGGLRLGWELLLHLSPVALLTLVFPIVSERISEVRIGGVGLSALVLAASLTVPWLSQAVCMPLYRGVGALSDGKDVDALRARFLAVWPLLALRALPVVAVFAVPVQLVMGWSLTALGAYLAMCVLQLLFAQSLVLSNMLGHRWSWAAAWTAYALVLLLVPQLWALPPLVGLITQLVPMRRQLRHLGTRVVLDRRDVAGDLRRGLLMGAVLWADKLVFFLAAGDRFAVDTVFLALLPAVLAYNVYFVVLAPVFDASVRSLRTAMEDAPLAQLTRYSRSMWEVVCDSIARTALAGAALGLSVTALVGLVEPAAVDLTATVAVASWLFMMTTVVCYKLDYVGQRTLAQVVGGLHLAATVVAFLVLPAGSVVYSALIAVEAVLFLVALRSCLDHWRRPEYTLFWRHATSW